MNVADAAKLDFATKFNFGISSSAHTKFWRMKLRCRSCSLGIPRLKILDIEVYFEFIYCFSNVQYAFALLLSFIYNQWGVNEVFFSRSEKVSRKWPFSKAKRTPISNELKLRAIYHISFFKKTLEFFNSSSHLSL